MNKIKKTWHILVILAGLALTGCEKNSLPATRALAADAYYGEWNGLTAVSRSFTNGKIVENVAVLNEIMSLRQESGKDTFNFKDPVTGMNIPGRQGTWYVVQISNDSDEALNNARVIKLRTITSATRITYITLTIRDSGPKNLVLNDGANKTLNYVIR
jgi:hypothetical protein